MPGVSMDESHITHLRKRLCKAISSVDVVFNKMEKLKHFLVQNAPADLKIRPGTLLKASRSMIPLRMYMPKTEASVTRGGLWYSGQEVAKKLFLLEFGTMGRMLIMDSTTFNFDRRNCRL